MQTQASLLLDINSCLGGAKRRELGKTACYNIAFFVKLNVIIYLMS